MKRVARAWVFAALGLLAASAQAADTVYYYSSDTVHSEVVVTDQNRNVVERTYYAPYGQVLNRDLRDGPGYGGHAEDPETGLVYMQQRYYDPEAGRFLSTDPVQADGNGGSFNRYAYANDNPYRYTDPNGMAASCSTGTHLSGQSCESLGVSVRQVGGLSVTEEKKLLGTLQESSSKGLAGGIDNAPIGSTQVGKLEKTMTNEIGSLSGGKPGELQKAKEALASTIINNAELKHPAKVAPATGTAAAQDVATMRAAYLDRILGYSDPVQGRTQYGTSASELKSRSASNGLKGTAGRETVYQGFGPFDNSIGPPTYIYIYNNPGH